MQEFNTLTQFRNAEDIKIQMSGIFDIDTSDVVRAKQEKAYQSLIREKLKSASDWQVRDSRTFSLK